VPNPGWTPFSMPATLQQTNLMSCTECGAVVPMGETWRHQNFHQKFDEINPPDIEDSIAKYDQALATMRYWIDGLYILLAEDPVFDPPRKIPTDADLERWQAPPAVYDEEPF
jgi:hypothetical protein